ncbi:hypothetical protein, variant [Cladophialophora immunda]|uniref:Uncharacterized protein n=1 Tax=Cladophialophora immunda TaxID=569365 RepID=A0A0D2CMT8_9EURO|nr:hypothetical protein, variant [Cladophialophora immunda]KIW32498.1 hypothetical protein, variant [Cladophialophora immunda]
MNKVPTGRCPPRVHRSSKVLHTESGHSFCMAPGWRNATLADQDQTMRSRLYVKRCDADGSREACDRYLVLHRWSLERQPYRDSQLWEARRIRAQVEGWRLIWRPRALLIISSCLGSFESDFHRGVVDARIASLAYVSHIADLTNDRRI